MQHQKERSSEAWVPNKHGTWRAAFLTACLGEDGEMFQRVSGFSPPAPLLGAMLLI